MAGRGATDISIRSAMHVHTNQGYVDIALHPNHALTVIPTDITNVQSVFILFWYVHSTRRKSQFCACAQSHALKSICIEGPSIYLQQHTFNHVSLSIFLSCFDRTLWQAIMPFNHLSL